VESFAFVGGALGVTIELRGVPYVDGAHLARRQLLEVGVQDLDLGALGRTAGGVGVAVAIMPASVAL
jgi:hypothetical protein